MRLRALLCVLTTSVLLALPTGPAAATSRPVRLQELARAQTGLLLRYYEGQNLSPGRCGQGQGPRGVDGVFLLPVASFTPGDRTVRCTTSARSVLVDLGGVVITEDNRPDSTYELDGVEVPFARQNLEPICDDLIEQGALGDPAPAELDGHRSISGPVLNSGVFTARVRRSAQIPGGADLWADSVALGHRGRLAAVFCGYKARVHLRPGRHTLVVDYTAGFGGVSTVFTYHLTVKR